MSSVTKRIQAITKQQDKGGYVPGRSFSKIQLTSEEELNDFERENIHASLVGMAVDYLTRFMNGASKEDAFKISLLGAIIVGEEKKAQKLLNTIKGLDNASIMCACKIVGYDVCFRAGTKGFKPIEQIKPNIETIENVRIMVNRGLKFFEEYGPITLQGFTFEGAYTSTIDSGDGDFLTRDTLWDFKVSKSGLNKNQTLQLLVYYLMGKRSIHKEFDSITKLGIYNPRQNIVYIKEIKDIDINVIKKVEYEVIGYGNKELEYASAYKKLQVINSKAKTNNISGQNTNTRSKRKRKKKKSNSLLSAVLVVIVFLFLYYVLTSF